MNSTRWCSHCRSHYRIDHYPDGNHGRTAEYGVVGVELAIVDAAVAFIKWYSEQTSDESATDIAMERPLDLLWVAVDTYNAQEGADVKVWW